MKNAKPTSKSFKKRKSYKKYGKSKFIAPNKKLFVKTVKQIISKQAENKIMNYTFPDQQNIFIYTNGSWATNCLFPISPYSGFLNCVQGTAQNNRIGNSITIKKAVIKLMFNIRGYSATNNIMPVPVILKIITFYDKLSTTVLPTGVIGLYQNGSSSSDPSTQSSIDMLKSYNKDRYVVKSTKYIKLGNSSYEAGAGGSITNQFSSNNDFKLFSTYSLDYTKHLNKIVKYNDTSPNPTTRGLYMAIFCTPANPTVVTGTNVYTTFSGFMDLEYEDL